jgi:hypothetical protein
MCLCRQECCRSITRKRELTGDIDFGGALEATEQIYSVATDASLRNGDPECDCRTGISVAPFVASPSRSRLVARTLISAQSG